MFFLTLWLLEKYDKICFDQVLFQLKTSSAGVHHALVGSAVVRVGVFGVIATALEICLYVLLSGRAAAFVTRSRRYAHYCQSQVCLFLRRRHLPLSVIVLVLCVSFLVVQLDIIPYLTTIATKSDFIEEQYVDPGQVELTFPEQKRNLVYIFLESMESSFSDTEVSENYIPELSQLAKEHISFSHTQGVGGAMSCLGTTWTASAMVSQTAGVPVKVPLAANAYGARDTFMPGAVSIGELLQDAGYQNVLLVGSDAEFHGREPYFRQHGDYTILDTKTLKESGRLPEDYNEWWGFEDEKLFAYAKEELMDLAAQGKPFNLTMLTADTHFPDGYTCRLCENNHPTQYANVLSCSSRQVAAFVSWIQQQPFYENTTIILSGDHLTMDADFLDNLGDDYVRTTYNCIINAPVTAANAANRQFATFDLFPTTLAALGVEIPGDRLGLGTNLFSERKTLIEEYGFVFLDHELQKRSLFYNTKILGMR